MRTVGSQSDACSETRHVLSTNSLAESEYEFKRGALYGPSYFALGRNRKEHLVHALFTTDSAT